MKQKHSLTIKIGKWLEAHATGWGLVALITVIALIVFEHVIRLSH